MSTTTTTERTFSLPAATLFATLVDPATYPRWLVGAKNIRDVSAEWPAPGSWFQHTVDFGPFAIPDRTTLRDLEPPHLLVLFVRARPVIEAVVQFNVIDKGPTCVVRMTETPAGPHKLMAPLIQPLVRARNERSLQRLDELIATA